MCGVVCGVPTKVPTVLQRKRGLFGDPEREPFCTSFEDFALPELISNPSVGRFAASGTAFSSPAAGDVLYAVEADATKPMSGGTADCSPSSVTTNKDSSGMPLKVTPGATAAQLNFTDCS